MEVDELEGTVVSTTVDELDTVVDVDVSTTVDELDTVVDVDVDVDVDEPATVVDVDVSTTVDELDGTDVFSAVRSKISAHIYPVKDSRLTSTDSARATGENAKTELSIPTITNKFRYVRAPFRLNLF